MSGGTLSRARQEADHCGLISLVAQKPHQILEQASEGRMPSQHRAPDASSRRRLLPAPALLSCAKILDKLVHIVPCRSVRTRSVGQRDGGPHKLQRERRRQDGTDVREKMSTPDTLALLGNLSRFYPPDFRNNPRYKLSPPCLILRDQAGSTCSRAR